MFPNLPRHSKVYRAQLHSKMAQPNELAGISMIAMAGMPNAKTEKMNMIGMTRMVFENT